MYPIREWVLPKFHSLFTICVQILFMYLFCWILTGVVTGERTRLIVFGVARIHRTRLLATLSGLKLEAEITNLHSSLTCRKKSRPASLECSLTGHIGRTMIVLLEGVAPNQQWVLQNRMWILWSSYSWYSIECLDDTGCYEDRLLIVSTETSCQCYYFLHSYGMETCVISRICALLTRGLQ